MHSILKRSVILAALVTALPWPSFAYHGAPEMGTLVKAGGSAVYYVAADRRRYAFPSERVYTSWYPTDQSVYDTEHFDGRRPDFSSVKGISDSDMAAIPFGGTVTFNPKIELLKLKTSPKVYFVHSQHQISWIANESAAESIYGEGWSHDVVEVGDGEFANYTINPVILDERSGYSRFKYGLEAYFIEDSLYRTPIIPDFQTFGAVNIVVAGVEAACNLKGANGHFIWQERGADGACANPGKVWEFSIGDVAPRLVTAIGREPSVNESGSVAWIEGVVNKDCLRTLVDGTEIFSNCAYGSAPGDVRTVYSGSNLLFNMPAYTDGAEGDCLHCIFYWNGSTTKNIFGSNSNYVNILERAHGSDYTTLGGYWVGRYHPGGWLSSLGALGVPPVTNTHEMGADKGGVYSSYRFPDFNSSWIVGDSGLGVIRVLSRRTDMMPLEIAREGSDPQISQTSNLVAWKEKGGVRYFDLDTHLTGTIPSVREFVLDGNTIYVLGSTSDAGNLVAVTIE